MTTGQTEHILNGVDDGSKLGTKSRLVGSLTELKGSNWKSMSGRMGRVGKD
jgi:hypothetical protein